MDMAILSGFFDSISDDRLYSAADITNYFLNLIPSGVVPGGLSVTAGSGLTVNVAPGWAFLKSRWVNVTEAQTLTLSASTSGTQTDRIILRLDLSSASRNISLAVRTGNENPPSLVRSGNIYEISLARVTVGTERVLSVVDERADSSVCGYVQGFDAFGGLRLSHLSPTAYSALAVKDSNTLYVVDPTLEV